MALEDENILNLDLNKYPHLLKIMKRDSDEFKAIFESIFALGDSMAGQGQLKKCQDTFHIPYFTLLNELMDAMFDYKGILQHHYSKQEAAAMATLGMENNPLSSTQFYTSDGKDIKKDEFFGDPNITVREWFQSMLYAGKYLSHIDLVKYLMLSEFHLVENMQNEHIERLLRIQPALKYQQENGIRIGSYVQGTGYFDVGQFQTWEDRCPICYSDHVFSVHAHETHYCLNCNAGIPFIVEPEEPSLASKYLEY